MPELIDLNEVNFPTAITQGGVTIVNYTLGDVNSNGTITFTNSFPENGLAPGETKTYTVTFTGLTYGMNYITVTVDPANNINESTKTDNTFSQSFIVN